MVLGPGSYAVMHAESCTCIEISLKGYATTYSNIVSTVISNSGRPKCQRVKNQTDHCHACVPCVHWWLTFVWNWPDINEFNELCTNTVLFWRCCLLSVHILIGYLHWQKPNVGKKKKPGFFNVPFTLSKEKPNNIRQKKKRWEKNPNLISLLLPLFFNTFKKKSSALITLLSWANWSQSHAQWH